MAGHDAGGAPVPDSFFRRVVDDTAIPFVAIDYAGVIRFASRTVTELLGWAPGQLVGHDVLDFVDEAHHDRALTGLSEVMVEPVYDAGVPLVLPIRHADGHEVTMEVAAMPPPREGDGTDTLTTIRIRSWEPQRHLRDFLHQLLEDSPLPLLLEPLTRSIAASLRATEVAVHHGFDGSRFLSASGSWPGAADLPIDDERWVAAVEAGGVLAMRLPEGDDRRRTLWLKGVRSTSVSPAVLAVWTPIEGHPLLGHETILEEGARYVQLALVRTAEHQRLVHLARHDPLTGIANRASFRERLASGLAIGETDVAVGFCDLDNFKEVNDRYGHAVGDEILVSVAARLSAALRAGDEIARMGGDEFTVLWRRIPDAASAQRLADRLIDVMAEPLAVPGGTVRLGLSIGVVIATEGMTADALLVAADGALYRSKAAGGGRSTVGLPQH